jgi:hypothetical protein
MVRSKLNIVRNASIVVALLFACWLGFPIPPRTATTADIFVPQPNATTTADVQTVAPIPPSLAGDERSVPVLKDVLATLRQIDRRLEHIENLMVENQKR